MFSADRMRGRNLHIRGFGAPPSTPLARAKGFVETDRTQDIVLKASLPLPPGLMRVTLKGETVEYFGYEIDPESGLESVRQGQIEIDGSKRQELIELGTVVKR